MPCIALPSLAPSLVPSSHSRFALERAVINTTPRALRSSSLRSSSLRSGARYLTHLASNAA